MYSARCQCHQYIAILLLDSYTKLPIWLPITRSLYIKNNSANLLFIR